jgi:hypothetical protein
MKYSKVVVFFLIVILSFSNSCVQKSDSRQQSDNLANGNFNNRNNYIIHYNIIFAPDLSNRITTYSKPLKDEQIIKVVLDNIYPNILTHKRLTQQKDKFSVSFINDRLISEYNIDFNNLSIDFSKFNNQQRDRIDYIMGRSPQTLAQDISTFEQEVQSFYSKAGDNTFGADLWSYFQSGIDNIMIHVGEEPFEANGKTYINKFRNILILLTDGYLEAGMYGNSSCPQRNLCYDLSKTRVDEFRRAFQASGEQDLQVFFDKNNYGLVPVSNPNLEELEVLVLEIYDRSLSKGGSATVHPTDMEILKLFWSDWLKKSGVIRYELRPVVSSRAEVEKVILSFLGIS